MAVKYGSHNINEEGSIVLDGISILKKLRNSRITIPVIVLTAKGETKDKVLRLDSGADDSLSKPFETEELMARLRALIRRKGRYTAGRYCNSRRC